MLAPIAKSGFNLIFSLALLICGERGFAYTAQVENISEHSDVNGIKELMDMETHFGRARVDEAVRLLGQKNPDNPLRTMAYLIGTIRNLKN